MRIINLKKTEIGAVVTTIDAKLPVHMDTQLSSLSSLLNAAPRVFAFGPEELPKADGLKWFRSPSPCTLSRALSTYMGNFGGHELCLLADPTITVNKEAVQDLVKSIQSRQAMLTWGAHVDGGFVFTAQTIAYLQAAAGAVNFTDWIPFVHKWAGNHLRHRYVDGRPFGISAHLPTIKKVELSAPEPERKRPSVVKRVKTRA